MVDTVYENYIRPDAPDPARTRGIILYNSRAELDLVREHLQQCRLQVTGAVETSYGTHQVTMLDPDGYSVRFQCPLLHCRSRCGCRTERI